MTTTNPIDEITNELAQCKKINRKELLRECMNNRIVECDEEHEKLIDCQIRRLYDDFSKLDVWQMKSFIKKLSRAIDKRYLDYTQQLIKYRDSLTK